MYFSNCDFKINLIILYFHKMYMVDMDDLKCILHLKFTKNKILLGITILFQNNYLF